MSGFFYFPSTSNSSILLIDSWLIFSSSFFLLGSNPWRDLDVVIIPVMTPRSIAELA